MRNTSSPNRIPCSLLVALAALIMHASAGEVSGQDTKEALSPSQLKARVASLRSRFHAEREEAVAVLGAPGTQAAELLEETAVSGYAPERACAIRALCAAAPERAARLLVEAVMHEIISVRVSAVRAARALGVDGAKALLSRLPEMPPEKHKAMRSLIAGACEEFVEKTLSRIAGSPEGQGQFPGQYRELTSMGPVVEPALSIIASDPSHALVERAAAALGELGDKAAVGALKRAYLAGGGDLKETAAAVLHILGEDGPYREVESLLRKACREGNEYDYTNLALFYDRAREHGKGEKVLRELIDRFGGRAIDHINLACMLSVQNKVEDAFEQFVKGVEKGYTDMQWTKIDGELANLRASKQFQSFVRKRFPEDFKEQEKPRTAGEDK